MPVFIPAMLFICLVGSCFVPAGILSAAMLAGIILLLADPYAPVIRPFFPGIVWFGIIIVSGLAGAVGRSLYDVAKDLWYVANPALTLLFGYLAAARMKSCLQPTLRAFVAAAMVVAIVHFSHFLQEPSRLLGSLSDIRSDAGAGYLIVALGFGIAGGGLLGFSPVLSSRVMTWLVMTFCLLSVTLSFSRTLWLTVVTMFATLLLLKNARTLLHLTLVAVVIIVIVQVSYDNTSYVAEGGADDSFIDKIMYSVREMNISDYENPVDINRNWRGFEAYRALETYAAEPPVDYLFGKGFGAMIDLGFTMTLADEEFDSIPILHNGYLYLLVKTGLSGLAAYLFFLSGVLRTGVRLLRLPDMDDRCCGFLLIVLTLLMVETTLVIAGMFNKYWVYPATLLMGVLLGYAETCRMSMKETPCSRKFIC
jgi:hypothetical protein